MVLLHQSYIPLFSSSELQEIELLWDKSTEVVKEFDDRSYTSSYTTKINTYSSRLLDWGDEQLGFPIRREGCNLILHRFKEGDYFDKHHDNVKRENNFRTYVIGFNINDEYEGGDYIIYGKHSTVLRKDPGLPYIMRADQIHEIKPVTRGTRKSGLIFLFERNTNRVTVL